MVLRPDGMRGGMEWCCEKAVRVGGMYWWYGNGMGDVGMVCNGGTEWWYGKVLWDDGMER